MSLPVLPQLPSYLAERVLRQLDFSEVLTLSLVDRKTRHLLLPFIYRHMCTPTSEIHPYHLYAPPQCADVQHHLAKHGRWVKRMRFNFTACKVDNPFALITENYRHLPRITQLKIQGVSGMHNAYMTGFLLPLRHTLTHLSLSQVERHNARFDPEFLYHSLLHFTKLAVLELIGSRLKLTYDQWCAIFRQCHGIRVLRVRGCGDDQIIRAAMECLPQLEKLQVSFHQVTPTVLAQVPYAFPHLTSLFVYPLSVQNNFIVEAITPETLPRLKFLDMTCDRYDRSRPSVASLQRFATMFAKPWPRLQSVVFDSATLEDQVLHLIAKNCPQLRRIRLDDCYISPQGYRYAMQHCTGLDSFRVRNVKGGLSKAMIAAVVGSPKLHRLEMIINGFETEWLFDLCPRLETLTELTLYKFNKNVNVEELQKRLPHVKISYAC
ncbi:hypothetical protein H4R34_001708 [Dimargaris verticillata]|uniref:F-box domain-containing protein n=1 Tax=Dimargaris verticillata TaxID=2761393 RepID=A0A9W8B337_9FUNG|nr:hypothetical protein H4R34_001708 [Dimargaris verticillata]